MMLAAMGCLEEVMRDNGGGVTGEKGKKERWAGG